MFAIIFEKNLFIFIMFHIKYKINRKYKYPKESKIPLIKTFEFSFIIVSNEFVNFSITESSISLILLYFYIK